MPRRRRRRAFRQRIARSLTSFRFETPHADFPQFFALQLLTTLGQAANALRNAAAMAESFAALVQHSAFVPQLPGHPLSMFQMFAPPGQGQGQMQPFQTSIAPMTPGVAPTAPAEGSNGRKRGARNATPADEDAVGADGKKKRKRAPAGEKKEKKVRDPNAPKRPPSAYLLFQNEVRKEMQARYPDKPYHEVLTRISERWSKMNDDDKKVRRVFFRKIAEMNERFLYRSTMT